MEPEVSLPCWQQPATFPYSVQERFKLQTHFLKIHLILTSHQRLDLPSGLLPTGFAIKNLWAFLVSLIRGVCTAYLILLDLLIIIIFSDEYRLRWVSCIVSDYGLDDRGSISGRGKRFFLYPLYPGHLWGPPSLLWNGYRGFFPGG
jgi:hypothetical protein